MMQPHKLKGILGGTFDPIHRGHLALATAVLGHFPVSGIDLMLCACPPHRPPPKASVFHRLRMLELAIQDHPLLGIETCELTATLPSYTAHTLPLLKKKYPKTPLACILGMDAFNHFDTWKDHETLLQNCHLILVDRAGHPFAPSRTLKALYQAHLTHDVSALTEQPYGCIALFHWDGPNISSTQIRKQRLHGHFPLNDVPQTVSEYIQNQNLYVD